MKSVEWAIDSTRTIGGLKVEVQGAPSVVRAEAGDALLFNGADDALFLTANPLDGAACVTVEAVFRPDAGGLPEQRFVHIQEDGSENRILLETRASPQSWYGDTYIRSGATDSPLNDPALTHPFGQWHTMAMVFDGREMIQYLDGRRELSAAIRFDPLRAGRISIGCRINRIHWFKGAIRLLRFTRAALQPHQLLVP
jgi:hypothetical protein